MILSLLKTDLTSITGLCIFSVFSKGKSSLILISVFLWEQTTEILLFNINKRSNSIDKFSNIFH